MGHPVRSTVWWNRLHSLEHDGGLDHVPPKRHLPIQHDPVCILRITSACPQRSELTSLRVGLCFLANGFGCVAGSISAGRSLDYDYRREAQLWQFARRIHPETPIPSKIIPASFPLEKARLGKGYVYTIVTIWSLLLFGWSLTAPGPNNDPKSHWIVPLLAQFSAGWSATSVLTSNNALVVDLYPASSASASAILNLSRCLMAAGGVAAVNPFLQAFGPGYLSVLLIGIVAIGVVPYWLHRTCGQLWRERRARKA